MNELTRSTVGFCDSFTTINSHGNDSLEITEFLCRDLARGEHGDGQIIYDVKANTEQEKYSLYQAKECLYSGNQAYDLAYTLINEILYQSIVSNQAGQAIHAAALATDMGGVLIPGVSGSGKSTFATWLTACGCNYLTDELVILSSNPATIQPFTRPISLKNGSLPLMCSFVDCHHPEVIYGANGAMIPHRIVNEEYAPASPPLSLVLFPQYVPDVQNELKKLPKALGCSQLMTCFVNARNFEDHGMTNIVAICRDTPMYQLRYSSFDRLFELLSQNFPNLF